MRCAICDREVKPGERTHVVRVEVGPTHVDVVRHADCLAAASDFADELYDAGAGRW